MSNTKKLRPTLEDYARAIGYAGIAVWTVVFYLNPPSAFLSELATFSRALWLGITFVGAVGAFFGALLRIDIKVEFPGILFTIVGPIFYCLSQVYLVIRPPEGADPSQRVHLMVYAILPALLLLPRTIGLLSEKNRLKGLAK